MWRFERPVDKKWFFHIVNSAHSEESVNTSKKDGAIECHTQELRLFAWKASWYVADCLTVRIEPLHAFDCQKSFIHTVSEIWEISQHVALRIYKQSSTRMRAGPGKSRPRRAAPRSGCSPVQPKSEGLDCCSHMPLQLALCWLIWMLQGSSGFWCTPGNEENRFERFSQLLHFVWLSYGKFFFLTSAKWSSSSKAAVYGGAGSSPAVDLRRFEGLVAWCRHDEAVGNALFRKPMHIAFTEWFVPSPMNSPFHCSETAKLREPPVQTGHLSPSLLDSSVTVTFGLQLFVFVHDFPLERSFSLCFSLAIDSSSFFFLSCCRAEFAGPTKKWYCPLPLATGGKHDTAPAASDNGPYFGMPAREFLIKMYAWRHGACGNNWFSTQYVTIFVHRGLDVNMLLQAVSCHWTILKQLRWFTS